MSNLYIRVSDLHYNLGFPWKKYKQCNFINSKNPKGVIITGDISNGVMFKNDLTYLAENINCPIYFVIGNHDMHYGSFEKTESVIKELSAKYSNLICLDNANPITIDEEDKIGLIGVSGWYDGGYGDKELLKWSFDRFLIKELRQLPNFKCQLEYFQFLAEESTRLAKQKLEAALEDHKIIYFATHFPPFFGSERAVGSWMEPYWLSYNVNKSLGDMMIEVMNNNKKRRLIVLAGHSHISSYIQVQKNIECIVSEASYTKTTSHSDYIYV